MFTAFSTIMPTRSCGVVTITIPSTGRDWNTVRGTSPVPGGMSTNMKSTSCHSTSVQNWVTAPAMTGPRQTTGSRSFSRMRFMLMICRPVWVVTGSRYSSVPMQWPVMSASSTAQLWPRRCISEASRLVTRDLPTPPLPLTTAITFLTDAPSRRGLRKLSAVRSEQFWLQVEQSCVHSLIV